ncbi:hypothetical protein [Candidatus Thiosymbion oneisti]|uniref:hypothetical protein n=1 Tax=Candidatus Thiosymbion oneisti TaxID=589554 RepID=UPI000B7F064A|nr:hypothetical protein [Candidatus Thiosymbion oneisti]
MLTVNFLIAGLSIWLVIIINNKYLQPALKNRSRFRLYRLRDELSVLAMKGELDERSEEYVTLIELINSAIRVTGSFKVTDFLRFVFQLHKDEAMRRKMEGIKRKLGRTDNPEYCRIVRDFFQTMQAMLHSETRILRHVFFPLFLFLAGVLVVFKLSSKPKMKVESKKKVIMEIDKEFHQYSDQFGRMCLA